MMKKLCVRPCCSDNIRVGKFGGRVAAGSVDDIIKEPRSIGSI